MPRIAEGHVSHIAGVVPQMDDVDIQAVSIYGTNAAAGDTPVAVRGDTGLRNAPWTALTPLADAGGNSRYLPQGYNDADLDTRTYPHLFNGASWDRRRNNATQVVLASAARGASLNSADQINFNHDHILLFLDISVRTAAETVQLEVEMEDPISGGYFSVWTAAAAVGAVGLYTYLLGPAAVAALYTEQVHIVVPRLWRLVSTQVAAGPITYSVAAVYMGH